MAKTKNIKYLIFISWAIISFILLKDSSVNPKGISELLKNLEFIHNIDKIVHALIFCYLALSLQFAFTIKPMLTFLILATYGICIEILQHILPVNRNFEWYDWYADIIGVLIGILLLKINFIHKILQVKN